MAALGKAISILVAAEMREHAMHEDVDVMHAPSECHTLVSKGAGKRMRAARRRALRVAGLRSMRLLRKAARKAMGNDAPIYRRYGFVPY